MGWSRSLKMLAKEVLFNSPLKRHFFRKFEYNFTVPQLCFLCSCLEDTRDVEGGIVEVGCANGATTVFLNKYMEEQGIEKEYYAIDTFSGFVDEDIAYEVENRGKKRDEYNGFRVNKKKWFDGTMEENGISRVRSIEADVNDFDLNSLGPLSFVLLDVDLYRPIKKALPELYDALSPNGMMIVDDCCTADVRYDGADQAFKEFVAEIDLPPQIEFGKLGIIKKEKPA